MPAIHADKIQIKIIKIQTVKASHINHAAVLSLFVRSAHFHHEAT